MGTDIPLILKLLQPNKGLGDGLIGQDGFVLLQGPLADLGVVCFRDGIFQECFFQFVEGDDYAENLS
jgi:hypothetical protein